MSESARHVRRQFKGLLEPTIRQREAFALRIEHDWKRPRLDRLGGRRGRGSGGRVDLERREGVGGRLGKVGENMLDRDDVTPLGLRHAHPAEGEGGVYVSSSECSSRRKARQ